jgi:hypothetical protein
LQKKPLHLANTSLSMLTGEKIKQVKKQLRPGVPQGEIKNDLINQGYSNEEIKKIFVPHKYDMRSWYLLFAILFFIAGINNAIIKSSFLFLLFSGGMFYAYHLERERIKKP